MRYAIIDIETTGNKATLGKITEIAIYVHDGKEIVDEFVSLVNPEQYIPPFITQLTGITNDMVKDAPKFYEIARRVVEVTEDCIFVAHNSSFDYGFIQAEFEALGFQYERETLCTVKLSRKLIPGHKSYSLGKICDYYGIGINGRHRAAGDAMATVSLFEILLSKNSGIIIPADNGYVSLADLHPNLDINKVKELPHSTGVYYFYNESDELIYIGKSTDIRKRVFNHIGNVKTQKAIKMKSQISRVEYAITGSELVALLKESAEIKKNKLVYNKAQRRNKVFYGIFSFKDRKGYIRFNIAKNDGRLTPLISFDSQKAAKEYMMNYAEEFNLCQKLSGLSDSVSACFQYQIKLCKGACVGEEASSEYNLRAEAFIKRISFGNSSMIIKDIGRTTEESSFVLIEKGKYLGYGFVASDTSVTDTNYLIDQLVYQEDNYDAKIIIKRQLSENENLEVIKL
ncbi:exonuclease domain-containing protein [Saccharicrinis aurantiacus]|uniref:exonuclease domain-containing protein n=1 Tax=Saccharicrinis aurantiacus TaxID=1849719 RepID=UPI0008382A1E|nr:exonuclease domain-containing protein [Saccharicrinis aurantiacus]